MVRPNLMVLAMATVVFASGQAQDRKISIADCQFAVDPEEFLSRAARSRGELFDRVARFSITASAKGSKASVAADSLPQRNFIDEEIFGKLRNQNVAAAAISSGEEFFRRIYLDLTGRIPTASEVRAFAADTATDKRDAIIEKLLASPEFTDRWTMWMGDLLQNTSTLTTAAVNRGPQGRNTFQTYIKNSVAKDKSLSMIATEVITGSGNNFEDATGAANFPLGASTAMGPDQDTYDTMLAKTTATFLGMSSYDCLLCHNGRNHLTLVSAWGVGQTRLRAQQMAAFFSRMSFATGPNKSFNVVESPSGAYGLNTNSGNRPDRAPVGLITSVTPSYRDSGGDAINSNWRAAFAEAMIADPMFRRNMANRIWKQIFGLGLVDPVDALDPARLDPANPPTAPWDLQATHPELLEKLGVELAKGNYSLRGFIRTLVQSNAYQLSSRYDGAWKEEYVTLFARHYARRMEAEEVHDAITKASAVPGDYAIQASSERVAWAMQLPEPLEPQGDAAVNNFLNTFLRGDRDTQGRSQSGSIQQQLSLMNDNFVARRIRVAQSAKLRAIAQLPSPEDVIDELYLTFLSRTPSAAEQASGMKFLAKSADRNSAVEDLAWMCINKTEFLFSY